MTCPTDESLTALLSASLKPTETDSIRAHLTQCSACQKRLDQLIDAPSLARRPKSKAEIAVAGIDPLMARLKRMNDKPPTQMRPLDHDDEEESPSIWRSVALVAMAAALILAGAWAWDHYRLLKRHKSATAATSLENTKARAVMDQLYAIAIKALDQKDAKAIEAKRDVATELLSYYQIQFDEAKIDSLRAAEAAEFAFRLAMLCEIVGPDVSAADSFTIALQLANALPVDQQRERERFCNQHMADLYAKANQWGRAEMALRRLLYDRQSKVNVNPQDTKLRRDLVALLLRIADASERNADFAGAVDSYRTAIELVEAELQQTPHSPFVREELAGLYESLGATLKKMKQVQQTELAEQAFQKAKAVREKK